MSIDGIEELSNSRLNEIKENVRNLENNRSVSFDEMFNSYFMTRFTNFESIDEFFDRSGFNADTEEDFEAIHREELDAYVAKQTKFDSWEEMVGKATEEYIFKLLGF
ncbi:hypothetical protein BK126_18160 [Paenibacillus sp. FSL H7-0326]|uniref:hypothetical protein n=1 Tax=Paenibacillus sp. FSL H7-0326 TaxID=1921144 RepID=UPI00096D6820|nr:hypothetical protein [Paenibacillus sp. FSL H7-0326]OMC67505.1 hypothetical protein BK126_18160 [Paenibacillus sp. FSL H7-0326]